MEACFTNRGLPNALFVQVFTYILQSFGKVIS